MKGSLTPVSNELIHVFGIQHHISNSILRHVPQGRAVMAFLFTLRLDGYTEYYYFAFHELRLYKSPTTLRDVTL